MSPLLLSTPTSYELSLSNHDLQVKDVQLHGDDGVSPPSVETSLSEPRDLHVPPCRSDVESVKIDSPCDEVPTVVEEASLNGDAVESVKALQPGVNKLLSHQEKTQAELDEWREWRKAHLHGPPPQNPVKMLADLFDNMGYPQSQTPVAPTLVEGISAWRRRKGRKSGGRFKSVSMP